MEILRRLNRIEPARVRAVWTAVVVLAAFKIADRIIDRVLDRVLPLKDDEEKDE